MGSEKFMRNIHFFFLSNFEQKWARSHRSKALNARDLNEVRECDLSHFSHVMRKPVFGTSDINQAVQPREMALEL